MSYEMKEIEAPRADWINWLRGFTVGAEKDTDPKDLPSIRVAIARLHNQTKRKVKFTTKGGIVKRLL